VARGLALAGYAGVLATVVYWYGIALPSEHLGAWLPAGLLLPLLPALPGLLRGRSYTHAWLSLLSLLYFTWSMTEALSNPPARVPATATLLATLLLFTGCVCFVRFSARERAGGVAS
jgi:uncharacterized membrane protein